MVIRNLALVGLLLATGPVLAQAQASAPASWHQGDPAHHKFQARLAELQTKLNLTAVQKPLWDDFVEVIKANRKTRMARLRTMATAAPQDAPERLDGRLAMLKQETLGVEQEKAALLPLWATLDAGQRSTLSKAIAWHPHHAKPGHDHPDSAE